MKSKQTLVLLGYALLLFAACKKETEETICGCTDKRAKNYKVIATCNDSSCVYTSNIIFWSNADSRKINVTMAGKKGTITLRYDGNYLQPTCAAVKLAKFSLPPGIYSYHAETEYSQFGPPMIWDDTITLDTMHWSADCVFENLR